MTKIYFVRHAQSDWRSGPDRERGLTAEALEDRRVVLAFLRDKPVDAFYCSPYRRSMDTIQEAADYFGLPIHTDARLPERAATAWSCSRSGGLTSAGTSPAGSACGPSSRGTSPP